MSKNLLQMKFMQRAKADAEKEKAEQSSSNVQDADLLELCRKEGDRYLTTNSFLYCANLRYGRMSYKGMNPEIEKLMELKDPKNDRTSSANNDNDDITEVEFSNNEMAQNRKKMKTQRYSRK